MKDSMRVRGFMRVQVVDAKTGHIVSDSGWRKNTVVNLGFQDYIVGSIGNVGTSKQVAFMAIGTGTVPAATDTSLAGETGKRVGVSNTVISSKTLQATAQFAGSDMAGTCTIANVALADVSSGGTILCGTTYATSQWASNQNVNATLFSDGVEWVATSIEKLLKVGGHLCEIAKTIPSQAMNKIMEGVENGWAALLNIFAAGEGSFRTA